MQNHLHHLLPHLNHTRRVRKQRAGSAGGWLHFIQSRTPASGMVSPAFTVDLSCFVKPFWNCFHRLMQSCVYLMILNKFTVTRKINILHAAKHATLEGKVSKVWMPTEKKKKTNWNRSLDKHLVDRHKDLERKVVSRAKNPVGWWELKCHLGNVVKGLVIRPFVVGEG